MDLEVPYFHPGPRPTAGRWREGRLRAQQLSSWGDERLMDHGKNAYKKNARNPQISGSQMPNFLTFCWAMTMSQVQHGSATAWAGNFSVRSPASQVKERKRRVPRRPRRPPCHQGWRHRMGNPNRPMNGWSILGVWRSKRAEIDFKFWLVTKSIYHPLPGGSSMTSAWMMILFVCHTKGSTPTAFLGEDCVMGHCWGDL